jgi:hypothetical protein
MKAFCDVFLWFRTCSPLPIGGGVTINYGERLGGNPTPFLSHWGQYQAMNIRLMTGAGYKWGFALLTGLGIAGLCHGQQLPPRSASQRPASHYMATGPVLYKGLHIGKSTLDDARTLFGPPDKFICEDKLEHWSYRAVDQFSGEVDVVGDVTTRTISSVTIYPVKLELKAFLARFGDGCKIATFAMDSCKSSGGVVPLYRSKTGGIRIAECRKAGVTALLRDNNSIQWIQFYAELIGFEKPACH